MPAARPAAPSTSRRKPIRRCCRSRSRRRLPPAQRGFRWGTLFWAAIGGLILLGLGLGVTHLIEDLFARSEGLGFLGLGFAAAAALAFAVIVAREALGLARLATIEKLHQRAAACSRATIARESRVHRAGPVKLAHQNPHLARARATLARPCRRHHRRRRHDPAGGARTDDAARSGSAPAGLLGRPARLARHRRQSARPDRRAVRVRGVAAADPAIGAALWRTARRARHDRA